ncbi:MAG TPA: peptide chain release factor N(5)-glutamine methyltransferase [Oscillatoriaceae cyanobacterium]
MPTIGDALYDSSRQLLDAGIQTGSLEASLLLGQATGLDRLRLITSTAEALTDEAWDRFQDLLSRRLRREPLQYIMGETEFMGLRFVVSPEVLIPRPDTEILVETILDLEEERGETAPIRAADVGTGSGAIAVVLAKSLPYLTMVATDVSTGALAVAHANAKAQEVAAQIDFRQGDGLAPLDGQFRYLISNPPYIAEREVEGLEPEVRDFEPHLALTPGQDPLHWYRTFAEAGASYVERGGYLVVEVGMDQAPEVTALLEASPHWEGVDARKDLGGIERVVFARRK